MIRRPSRQGGAGWTMLPLFVALSVLNNANLCTGQFPQLPNDAINTACRLCDDQFGTFMINPYAVVQGAGSLSPQDVGHMLCRQVNNISNCYKDCVQGTSYQYTSVSSTFAGMLYELCKPTGCDLSYVPGCYLTISARIFSGTTISTSACDPIGGTTSASLSQCIDLYANQQNCTGMCSESQRALKILKFGQEIVCQIPLTNVLCTAAVQACVSPAFGILGTNFISGNSLTSASSNEICSLGRTFSTCMANTLNGNSITGPGPCSSLSDAVGKLIAISDTIFKPFCDHPAQNFASVCALESSASGSGCMKRRR